MKAMTDRGLETRADPIRPMGARVTRRERDTRSRRRHGMQIVLAPEHPHAAQREILLDHVKGETAHLHNSTHTLKQVSTSIAAFHFTSHSGLRSGRAERNWQQPAQEKRRRRAHLLIKQQRLPNERWRGRKILPRGNKAKA